MVISMHCWTVGRVVTFAIRVSARTQRAISRLKASRKGCRLDGLSWRELRDTGRR